MREHAPHTQDLLTAKGQASEQIVEAQIEFAKVDPLDLAAAGTTARAMPPTSRLSSALAKLFESDALTARVLCLALWAVTPLSWAAVVLYWSGRCSVWRVAVLWAHAEVALALYLRWLASHLTPLAVPRPFDEDATGRLFRQTLAVGLGDRSDRLSPDDPLAVDFREQVRPPQARN